MKTVTFIFIGVLIFTLVYSTIIFNSHFGVPDTVSYSYGYPCNSEFIKSTNLFGYQFKNCYILKLNFWDRS